MIKILYLKLTTIVFKQAFFETLNRRSFQMLCSGAVLSLFHLLADLPVYACSCAGRSRNLEEHVVSKLQPEKGVMFAVKVKSSVRVSPYTLKEAEIVRRVRDGKASKSEMQEYATRDLGFRDGAKYYLYKTSLVEVIYGKLPQSVKSFEIEAAVDNELNCGVTLAKNDIYVYTLSDLKRDSVKNGSLLLGRSVCYDEPVYTKNLSGRVKKIMANYRVLAQKHQRIRKVQRIGTRPDVF